VLPLALRVAAARPVAAAAVTGAERSIRALVDRLRAAEVPIATWLTLDPERLTLRDVDTPSDLEGVRGGDSGEKWGPDLR
jgi:molybdopterin-guanine dinucleotide biosynthesis protein A